jgi:hypothetical protein
MLSTYQGGAIERVQDPFQSPGFYSRLILVPKITGDMKPVIDLSILNTFLLLPHFKMETKKTELPPTEESASLCQTCETKRWESLTVEVTSETEDEVPRNY